MKHSTLFCKLIKVWGLHHWTCDDSRIHLFSRYVIILSWNFWNIFCRTFTSLKNPRLGLRSSEPMKRTFFLDPFTKSGRVEAKRSKGNVLLPSILNTTVSHFCKLSHSVKFTVLVIFYVIKRWEQGVQDNSIGSCIHWHHLKAFELSIGQDKQRSQILISVRIIDIKECLEHVLEIKLLGVDALQTKAYSHSVWKGIKG